MLYSKTSARGNREQEFVFSNHMSASIEHFRRLWKFLLTLRLHTSPKETTVTVSSEFYKKNPVFGV